MISLDRLESWWNLFRWIFYLIVLSGILLTLLPTRCDDGRGHVRSAAKNDLMMTVVALKAFRNEYANFPLEVPPETADLQINGDRQKEMYNVLRAIEKSSRIQNTRGTVFVESKPARGTPPKRGFGGDGTLYDPWGGIYQYVLDTDGNGKVTIPEEWKRPDSGTTIEMEVIGYSPGKTDNFTDDVTTW